VDADISDLQSGFYIFLPSVSGEIDETIIKKKRTDKNLNFVLNKIILKEK